MVEESKTATGKSKTYPDLESEFRQSFNDALLSEKYQAIAFDYILNTNPFERILKPSENLDENIKKNVLDRVQAMMQTWMLSFEQALEEGKSIPKDFLGYVADLARIRRSKLNE